MNPDLERWVGTATDGLAEISREEIRREIAAHYEEALQAHRSEGLDGASAHAAALADLGDPAAANRGFRKSHFTEKEWKLLLRMARPVFRPVPTVLISLFIVAYFAGYAAAYHRWDTLWLIPALAIGAWPCFALQRWAMRRFGLRGGIIAMFFTSQTAGFGIYVYLARPHRELYVGGMIWALVGFLLFLRSAYGGIWRKAWRLKGHLPLTQ
jgi:hypothetical protein